MMEIEWGHLLKAVVECVVFTAIGLLAFGLAFTAVDKLTPFSLRKEIEEDQNTALGILIGSMILGIAIIVAAAIRG